VLPRSLYLELRDGIDALAEGETTPLLQAQLSRRHGATWSRDQMRLRALEHVHFLVGQGVAKGKARKRVSAAMGNVSVETLRDWEERECPRVILGLDAKLNDAWGAGALLAKFRDDPEYAAREGEKEFWAYELSLAEKLSKEEPLAALGKRYAAQFGSHHRSRPQDADN